MNQLLESFISKINAGSQTECWEWIGSKNKTGYGIFHHGIGDMAHRLSYELFHREYPAHNFVLHMCDNPICVNPYHLVLGCHQDNMRHKVERNRSGKKDLCKRGHPLSGDNLIKTKVGRACKKCRDMHNSINNPKTNKIVKDNGKYIKKTYSC